MKLTASNALLSYCHTSYDLTANKGETCQSAWTGSTSLVLTAGPITTNTTLVFILPLAKHFAQSLC